MYVCVCVFVCPWCWERLRAGGEGDDRGWDGWMASPTQWTRVWVNSRSWWWTGRPGIAVHGVTKSWTWLSNWTELKSLQSYPTLAIPWMVALQAPLSMEFSRQEYWSGLSRPLSGDLPNPGTEPTSLISPTLAGGLFTTSAIWEACFKRRNEETSTVQGVSLPSVSWVRNSADQFITKAKPLRFSIFIFINFVLNMNMRHSGSVFI